VAVQAAVEKPNTVRGSGLVLSKNEGLPCTRGGRRRTLGRLLRRAPGSAAPSC